MVRFLMASAVILLVLLGWIWVQQAYAAFARRNPQLGPFRQEGDGCSSGSCACGSTHCTKH